MMCSACHAPLSDHARFCPMCGAPASAPGAVREARKNVAILFMDLVGSTALAESLDPEPLRQVIDRYFEAASSAIADHGGAVEKFIGDAVVAVFGATVSHEDDALRAIRAATQAVDQVQELSAGLLASHKVTLEVRCGICSGEVMAITQPSGDFRVIGDAVNTAARLQTAAEPGDILVDSTSASMVRGYIGLEPVPPMLLKGKAQPVQAWRVTGGEVPREQITTPPALPLVGRHDELAELKLAFKRVAKRDQICLVTVLGAPGIGKSRLVQEFVSSFSPAQVSMLTGRCSAYGRGTTYQPLAQMLSEIGWADHASRMESQGGEAERAALSLSGIMSDGPPGSSEPAGIEDISWAVRYLLRQLGRSKPVIMVWEDLHWAESTLLDMIDDLVSWLTDVPVLLLCVSRMELLDARPGWAGGKPSVITMEVGPLGSAECVELVTTLAMREEVSAHQTAVRCEQIATECEGNPLFAELMLDLVAETAPGAKLPPTITALLTARLDRLPHGERQLLEVASVIGRDFSSTMLATMLASEGQVAADQMEILDRLVKRRIIARAEGDSFRFSQALMREMAYALSPKTTRERWHLLLAGEMARLIAASGADSLNEHQMALAFQVEAARLLQRELRPGDTNLPALAPQAAGILISEGTRALRRRDLPGAAALLERARALVASDDERQVPLMLYISDCWLGLSQSAKALAAVAEPYDPSHDVICRIQRCIIELTLGLVGPGEIASRADELERDLSNGEHARHEPDDRGWCRLYQLRAYLHRAAEATAKAEAEFRLALDRATVLRDGYETDRLLGAICELAQWAPTPAPAGLALCAELSMRFATNRALLVPVLLTRARLSAISGRLDDARAALSAARTYITDLHLDVAEVVIIGVSSLVDALAGDHRQAEAGYRRSQDLLLQIGRPNDAMVYAAYAARELFEQGNATGAGLAVHRITRDALWLDLRTRVIVKALLARVACATGNPGDGAAQAAAAASLSEETDDLCLQGDCYADLAIVSAQAGMPGPAADAAATALSRYLAKGATMLADRLRRLDLIADGSPTGSAT